MLCPTVCHLSHTPSLQVLITPGFSIPGAGRREEGSELCGLPQYRAGPKHHSCLVLVTAGAPVAALPPIPVLLNCECGLGLCWHSLTWIISAQWPEEGSARPQPLDQATQRDRKEMELLQFSEHVGVLLPVFGVLLLCVYGVPREWSREKCFHLLLFKQ